MKKAHMTLTACQGCDHPATGSPRVVTCDHRQKEDGARSWGAMRLELLIRSLSWYDGSDGAREVQKCRSRQRHSGTLAAGSPTDDNKGPCPGFWDGPSCALCMYVVSGSRSAGATVKFGPMRVFSIHRDCNLRLQFGRGWLCTVLQLRKSARIAGPKTRIASATNMSYHGQVGTVQGRACHWRAEAL